MNPKVGSAARVGCFLIAIAECVALLIACMGVASVNSPIFGVGEGAGSGHSAGVSDREFMLVIWVILALPYFGILRTIAMGKTELRALILIFSFLGIAAMTFFEAKLPLAQSVWWVGGNCALMVLYWVGRQDSPFPGPEPD